MMEDFLMCKYSLGSAWYQSSPSETEDKEEAKGDKAQMRQLLPAPPLPALP